MKHYYYLVTFTYSIGGGRYFKTDKMYSNEDDAEREIRNRLFCVDSIKQVSQETYNNIKGI